MKPTETNQNQPPSRYFISMFEVLIIVAIASSLCSLLLPAVNIIKERNGEPPAWPWLHWLFQFQDGIFLLLFPMLSVLLTSICLLLLKRRLSSP